jgi:hypothetical protein
MSDILARRYARLLSLYPAEYRRARGAELLETLRETAEPGRTRPSARETTALVVGALRARAGRGSRRTSRHSWLAAFRIAALTLLLHDAANTAVHAARTVADSDGILSLLSPSAVPVLALLPNCYAVIAVARGRYRSAVAAAGAGFVLMQVVAAPSFGPATDGFWLVPLAIACLIPLLNRPLDRASGLLRYVPAVPILFVAVDYYAKLVGPAAAPVQYAVLGLVCAAGLLWLAIDERVALAVGLLMINGLLAQLAFAVLAPVVLLLLGGSAVRRQARL